VGEHGFLYASEAIAKGVSVPEGDRKLRDFLVRVGLARSPTLRAIDASIAAQERVLTASQRAFWVPSLSVGAGVDHLFSNNSDDPAIQETEWGARAQLTFPLFEGGAKFASLRQARESLESLRLDRRAQVDSLDDGIRTAFARASGAYRAVGYAGRQQAAALKNYEFVYEAYVLGVSDYLDLLDAQNQSLTAEISVVNALYDFLGELLAAEQQIAFFPFLEQPDQVGAILRGLEREVGVGASAEPGQDGDR
jgi:outer membrane protein TolC